MSLIFGTVLLCRLDRCLLMRGFERFDTGIYITGACPNVLLN